MTHNPDNPTEHRRSKMATVDMDSVGSFEVYPSGTYRVEVTGWERGESSQKKTPQVRVKTKIVDGGAGDPGKPYTEFIQLTEKSAWKAGNFIHACGVNMKGKLDTDSPLFTNVMDALVGKTLYITMEKDEQYGNNKSLSYARDDMQPEEDFVPTDDAPEFAK
jgi:hypothetical protein